MRIDVQTMCEGAATVQPAWAMSTGAHHDTMVASARAYVNALNKLLLKRGRAPVDIAQAG